MNKLSRNLNKSFTIERKLKFDFDSLKVCFKLSKIFILPNKYLKSFKYLSDVLIYDDSDLHGFFYIGIILLKHFIYLMVTKVSVKKTQIILENETGSSMNDVMQYLRFFYTPSPIVKLFSTTALYYRHKIFDTPSPLRL